MLEILFEESISGAERSGAKQGDGKGGEPNQKQEDEREDRIK
ncbi:hypothetical protein [Anaerosolibacter carboniphilus]|nr:hypothetical protein [Anaerosolibacter carboniphilus]